MILTTLFAQTGGQALGCASTEPKPVFIDAINLIFKERESINGGVCIGGLGQWLDFGATHLLVSFVAIAIAIAVAVPLGLWLGHTGKGEFLAITVSNVGRAVPALALIVAFVLFVGVGFLNIALVLALLAIPPILTNTFVGVQQVDVDLKAAARGMGLTEFQIMRQIELPLAAPTIFAGLRTSAVAVVATATIGPEANVLTLGAPILEPQTYGFPGQIAAAILVALVTVAVDFGFGRLEKTATPKGLRVGAASRPRGRLAFASPRTENQ
jgi:osmoprotectant transport system permease protein